MDAHEKVEETVKTISRPMKKPAGEICPRVTDGSPPPRAVSPISDNAVAIQGGAVVKLDKNDSGDRRPRPQCGHMDIRIGIALTISRHHLHQTLDFGKEAATSFAPQNFAAPRYSTMIIREILASYWEGSTNYKRQVFQDAPQVDNTPDPREEEWSLPYRFGKEFIDVNIFKNNDFLEGPIHPILQESNWIVDVPGWSATYANMRPALRLATMFLTQDTMLDWWTHVRYGKPSTTVGHKYLLQTQEEFSVTAKESVRRELEAFANRVRFTWLDSNALGRRTGATWSSLGPFMHWLTNGSNESWTSSPKWQQAKTMAFKGHVGYSSNPIIGIHLGYHSALNSTSTLVRTDIGIQFSLAKLLMHELAHAWYYRFQRTWPEIRAYSTDVMPEMGHSWEKATFGSHIECGYSVTGPLTAQAYEDLFPIITPISVAVPIQWLRKWFLTSTWRNANHMKESGEFNVPNTQSRSYPQLVRYERYENGKLVRCHERYENGQVVRHGTWQPLPLGFNISLQYQSVWAADAKRAYRDGNLDKRYYTPTWYANLVTDFVPPAWTNMGP